MTTEDRPNIDYTQIPHEDRNPYESIQADLHACGAFGSGPSADSTRKGVARFLTDRGWRPRNPAPERLSIQGNWLVAEDDECTCAASSMSTSCHEPGCGLEPLTDLSTLDGWPAPRKQLLAAAWRHGREYGEAAVSDQTVERLVAPGATPYDDGAEPTSDLHDMIQAQRDWSSHTFGPGTYLVAIDRDRCAVCAVCPSLPCAQHRETR